MKDLLNPWVIAGAVFIASVLLAVTFLAAGSVTPSDQLMLRLKPTVASKSGVM
jgi:hypothetical protein